MNLPKPPASCLLAALLVISSTLSQAQDAPTVSTLQKENAELRQRVDRLEQQLADIQKALTAAPATAVVPATAGTGAGAATAGFTEAEVARLKTIADPKQPPVHAGLDLKLYGYVKLDAAYDDSRTSVGNYARWAESEGGDDNDNQFSMTANQTRLGVELTGPPLTWLKTGGKVEIDFYGSGTSENKPEPLLRHAYLTADWTQWDFGMLAGQTSDIISPLFAPTVNYTVGWWQGNIGYRRPQLRLTKGFAFDKDWRLQLEAGATRTITGRKYLFTGATDPDSGDDSGFPTSQGRISLSFPTGDKRHGAVGVSGHWGEEDQHVTGSADHNSVATWSGNIDLRLPLTDWLLLQAEGFLGQNLDTYLGGIGQGIEPTTHEAVFDTGGWVAASLGPWNKWSVNGGSGFDNPQDSDLLAATARTFNFVGWGNLQYALTANLQLAFELSYLRTKYKGGDHGDDLREQLAVIYKF